MRIKKKAAMNKSIIHIKNIEVSTHFKKLPNTFRNDIDSLKKKKNFIEHVTKTDYILFLLTICHE